MKAIRVLAAASASIVLASGCERAMHDMYRQPHYKPMAPSTLWPDGTSSRPAVPGSVVANAGAFAMSSSEA